MPEPKYKDDKKIDFGLEVNTEISQTSFRKEPPLEIGPPKPLGPYEQKETGFQSAGITITKSRPTSRYGHSFSKVKGFAGIKRETTFEETQDTKLNAEMRFDGKYFGKDGLATGFCPKASFGVNYNLKTEEIAPGAKLNLGYNIGFGGKNNGWHNNNTIGPYTEISIENSNLSAGAGLQGNISLDPRKQKDPYKSPKLTLKAGVKKCLDVDKYTYFGGLGLKL